MVYDMVYVAQTYTVAEIPCASRFQRLYGIWVHVFLNSLETASVLLSNIRIFMRIMHKFARLCPLRRLEPPSDPFGGAKS